MSTRPAILEELIRFSTRIGRDIRLVQAAGGNTSIKDGNTLWVKASGTWLANASDQDIFVPLDLQRIRATIVAGQEDFSGCVIGDGKMRPSIETSLHALMSQRVVAHCHSVNVLAWAVRADGREQLADRLPDDWLWIPYARPGLALSQAVRAAQTSRPDCCVLLLANHGLVLAADSIAAAQELLEQVEERLQITERSWIAPATDTLVGMVVPGARLPALEVVHVLATDERARVIATSGALYPDHAVFLGTSVPTVDATVAELRPALTQLLERWPYCAIVPGRGVVLGEKCSPAVEAMLACCALVALRLDGTEQVRYLSDADVGAIVNWDMERHRIGLQQP